MGVGRRGNPPCGGWKGEKPTLWGGRKGGNPPYGAGRGGNPPYGIWQGEKPTLWGRKGEKPIL